MATRHINIRVSEEMLSKLKRVAAYYGITHNTMMTVLANRALHTQKMDWKLFGKVEKPVNLSVSIPTGEVIRSLRDTNSVAIKNIVFTLITEEYNSLFKENKQ